jgi:GR25 family glycosyltransferase involved in LPS biosynthesis
MKNFIICLSKISSSFESAIKLKNNLLKYEIESEFFEGVYGNDAVRIMAEEGRVLHSYGVKGAIGKDNKNIEKMQLPGVKGCFLSHYYLWEKCTEINEPIVVWEDDIEIIRPYYNISFKDVLIIALGHPAKSQRYIKYFKTPQGQPTAEPYFQSSMPGTCGYVIKPHAAKKLVEEYKNSYLSSDNAMNKNLIKLEIHSHVMGLAKTKSEGKKSLTKTKMWEKYV